MPEIHFLNGLSPEEVQERRNKRFLQHSPEEKLKTLFALIEISLLKGVNKSRPKAKLTLKRKMLILSKELLNAQQFKTINQK